MPLLKISESLELLCYHCSSDSGVKMSGVSKTSLLTLVVFAQFLALTANVWQVNKPRKMQEITMNQSKTTLFRSRNLKGLVFLSPDQLWISHSKTIPKARKGQLWKSREKWGIPKRHKLNRGRTLTRQIGKHLCLNAVPIYTPQGVLLILLGDCNI